MKLQTQMTVPELLNIYNAKNPEQPIRSWKKSKTILLEKFQKGRKIVEAVEELLWYQKEDGSGLRYDEILTHLQTEFPKSKCSLKGLRWYATTLQKKNPERRLPERPRRPRRRKED